MSDVLAEIKRIYYAATQNTIVRDFEQAIDLLKSMPSEEERERATVYMEGLAAMRKQWASVRSRQPQARKRPRRATHD